MSAATKQGMQQLALDLKLADFALFTTFHAGPNEQVLNAVMQAATEPGQHVAWIWGAPGSGRSHLLQAAVAAASNAGRACAWLPLGDGEDMQPAILEGMGALDLLCVDDVDQIAGDAQWERPLFKLFEELRARDGNLLVAASGTCAVSGFELQDLASRLASGPTWKLKSMDDDDRLAALQLRANWRGLDLPDDTGRYLLRRVDRSSRALFELLDRLDAAALTAQRRLTIPFVKSVLVSEPGVRL
jgi:DnaA family protein